MSNSDCCAVSCISQKNVGQALNPKNVVLIKRDLEKDT
jgi:hypothetical protein